MAKKDNNQRILVAALVIVGILLLVNFNMTGQITKQTMTEVTVFPREIGPNEILTVVADAGSEGMQGFVTLHSKSGLRKAQISMRDCPGLNRCQGIHTTTYRIPLTWDDGVYYARVFDRATGEHAEDAFAVKK